METLGQFLKEQRLKSNKSLEEISEVTKIRKGLLEALEQDKYEFLPPRSYVRGMVKLYAQEVGIDVNEVLDRFETAPIEKPSIKGGSRIQVSGTANILRRLLTLLIIIGVGIILYFAYITTDVQKDSPLMITASHETSVKQMPATTSVTSSAPVSSVPAKSSVPGFIASVVTEAVTPTAATSQKVSSLTSRPFTVKFEAQALTWIRIQADGKKSLHIILKAGESYRLSADNSINVRLGNAGGVSIYFNDLPLAPAGKSGEVVNLEFPEAAQQLFKGQ